MRPAEWSLGDPPPHELAAAMRSSGIVPSGSNGGSTGGGGGVSGGGSGSSSGATKRPPSTNGGRNSPNGAKRMKFGGNGSVIAHVSAMELVALGLNLQLSLKQFITNLQFL